MFKGFRTVLFNLIAVVSVPGLTYLAGVDWASIVNPTVALILAGLINVALRFVTDTKVGKKD